MQMLRAGAIKSSKSKAQVLIPYQHVHVMKIRYGLTDYEIGETVGGMLMVSIAKKHGREAMAIFDACKTTDIIVLSDARRARKSLPVAQKKVASR